MTDDIYVINQNLSEEDSPGLRLSSQGGVRVLNPLKQTSPKKANKTQ